MSNFFDVLNSSRLRWIAPEVLRADLTSVTYTIDVFSLGCVFYYVISEGLHPFGDQMHRQMNIRTGSYNLAYLKENSNHILPLIENGFNHLDDYVAMNVIEKMIEHEHQKRPSAIAVSRHPIFWSKDRQLQFFMDVSDRIEKEDDTSVVMQNLERDVKMVLKDGWIEHICRYLKEGLFSSQFCVQVNFVFKSKIT